jgi:hypothetical protein
MKFVTLGPAGSNHEFVTRRYLDFHGIAARADVALVVDFEEGAHAVLQGNADYLVQCAVHPATPRTVARWFDGLYAIDTFISPSQDLAVLQRHDAEDATCLAAMRPTLEYVDVSRWESVELVDTVAEVTQGLVTGAYDVGLGYAAAAQARPELLRITQFVGTVDDAWIVYGRSRLCNGQLAGWRDGPAGRLFRGGAPA